MKQVFADASFWIASLFPADKYHQQAIHYSTATGLRLVTTDLVIVETLNYGSELGPYIRKRLAAWASNLRLEFAVRIINLNSGLLDEAIALYGGRPDKGWSLVDCASMAVMQRLRISEALTSDHHFEQAGLTILLRT